MGIETSSSALVKAMFPVFLNWIIQGGDTAEQRVVRVSIVCEIPCDSVVVTRPHLFIQHMKACVCVSLHQVPVEAKPFIVIVHLKPDRSAQTPVDVQ